MSDCHKSRDLFSVILDQEASQFDQRLFDGHLSNCYDCRQDWLDFKASQAILKDLPRVAVSASFEDRVMAGMREAVRESRPAPAWVAEESEPRWWQAWLPRFTMAAATAALVIMAAGTVLHPKGQGGLVADLVNLNRDRPAVIEPAFQRLEDRFPDLPPEVLRSLDEESYVLDRMTVRPATSGDSRVVAPVDYEPGGAVYVTF